MAKLKTAKNLIQNRDEYARFFSDFRGVDFSSDHTDVIDQRFAYAVNMWRDYKSGEGGAVETIPGFRRVMEGKGEIYGLYPYKKALYAHVGTELLYVGKAFGGGYQITYQLDKEKNEYFIEHFFTSEDGFKGDRFTDKDIPFSYSLIKDIVVAKLIDDVEGVTEWVHTGFSVAENEETGTTTIALLDEEFYDGYPVRLYLQPIYRDMNPQSSTSVYFNERLYILDGKNLLEVTDDNCRMATKDAYVPTTHELIYPGSDDPEKAIGVEMKQRNILTPKYKNKFIAGTKATDEAAKAARFKGNVFQLKYGSDYAEHCKFHDGGSPEHVEVYQYGVKLPWAREVDKGNGIVYEVPLSSPNAVVSISKDGEVVLANTPPRPENNTWNPDKKAFDYTDAEIKEGKPDKDGYAWPYAFTENYDGIEITAENAITNINGIEAKDGYASIITKCTIATVFDNRLFLSGNPDFPTHIFWSGLNGETDYPDPTYFGITNNDIEGVTDSPVVAMIPVADQLMVLKKENASEGSVIFHTPTLGEDNVMSKVYPSTQGLAGRGCLGAACNFLDDPVFVSRFGLEAMGSYTNAKYERSIEHRSSLIDAKLLGYDLSKAQLIEYEGYLLLLVEGKIFMADSRATFTHQSGTMQYEWFYLEDIGVWEGQFEECVYAKLPTYIGENGSEEAASYWENSEYADWFAGRHPQEATSVRNELGVEENLIGQIAFRSEKDVTYALGDRGGKCYYKNLPYRDEYGNELGEYDVGSYYVEPTGAMMGGTFVPAEKLYVIGGDLYFSAGKYLCKFNFDKRNKSTGVIPVEWYSFDGRTIFSGCATKMDNCGIPHLTKNTVKRSTVIKTRTYTHSNAKIKIRTNKKTFTQVGRIINGNEVFEGMDFADFTFNIDGKTLFAVNEKEKKWVEKQHFIYSDRYCEPFAIHYIAYRYNVAGRYKE